MNRLWVRLSLMISLVLFSMFFMQFLAISLEQANNLKPDADGIRGPGGAPPAEIQRRLLEFMLFSVFVGTVGGGIIGRVISNPINGLTKAARRIGTGDLNARAPVNGSQEMRELAETFNNMAGALQHAEKLRTNLMADVSHELRTPLTVLEGNLRAALDHVYALDETEIANLYGQTRHLIRLVNDLRELSLAESHQLPLEKVPVDLNALVEETLLALEPMTTEKGVEIKLETTALVTLNIDPIRIRQVLFNLLSNALRHTPAGGQITIQIGLSNHEAHIAIQDDGEGLEPEQLAAVFDRFYRVDKSRSRETGGTGLGLAIVKAIVESHGGRVQVSSSGKGQGCQFSVLLPQEGIA